MLLKPKSEEVLIVLQEFSLNTAGLILRPYYGHP